MKQLKSKNKGGVENNEVNVKTQQGLQMTNSVQYTAGSANNE